MIGIYKFYMATCAMLCVTVITVSYLKRPKYIVTTASRLR